MAEIEFIRCLGRAAASFLELGELLGTLNTSGLNLQHIEPDGLAQRPALSNGDNIALLNTNKARTQMGSQVLVPLLVPVILWNIMQIVAPNNDGALHLGGDDDTSENTATNGDVAGEGTLCVNVGALDGFAWGLEAETDILEPAIVTTLLGDDLGELALAVDEDALLLLESFLGLISINNKMMMKSDVDKYLCVHGNCENALKRQSKSFAFGRHNPYLTL